LDTKIEVLGVTEGSVRCARSFETTQDYASIRISKRLGFDAVVKGSQFNLVKEKEAKLLAYNFA
jgi:hypothetical protein